ncbi:MAG TPA: hypothetical protein VMA09_00150 [Candidatus Binataceae bacterium]|nr:hypothetical protein [Candidatus Binataceae bacterium]
MKYRMKISAALLLACIAAPAVSFAQWQPHSGYGPGYGYGPQGTTAALSSSQKSNLIGQLEKAKERDEIDFRNSPGHWQGRDYQAHIREITGMINGLRSGMNYPMGEVQQAMSAGGRYYH